jgi:predicted nucleotidyltransferase
MQVCLNPETETQIARCLRLLESILGPELLGMYLCGSSVVGGLQPYSDLDLFVVSNRPTTREERAWLAAGLLSISRNFFAMLSEIVSTGIDPDPSQRPIEMVIVVKSEINPWHYPPAFDFQYGDWLRKAFENGNVEPWPTKVMPDLALLITQVLLASKTLLGPAPEELLAPVPYHDFIIASVKELDSLMADLASDTRNVLLTFARIWSTVVTDAIRSKPDAAAWVLARLPAAYRPVMQRARAICIGEEPEHWRDLHALIQPCADFMVSKIREQISLLESSDQTHRSIRLA